MYIYVIIIVNNEVFFETIRPMFFRNAWIIPGKCIKMIFIVKFENMPF